MRNNSFCEQPVQLVAHKKNKLRLNTSRANITWNIVFTKTFWLVLCANVSNISALAIKRQLKGHIVRFTTFYSGKKISVNLLRVSFWSCFKVETILSVASKAKRKKPFVLKKQIDVESRNFLRWPMLLNEIMVQSDTLFTCRKIWLLTDNFFKNKIAIE